MDKKIFYNGNGYYSYEDLALNLEKHFTEDLKKIREDYIATHPVTEDNINNKAICMGIDIVREPEKKQEVIDRLKDDVKRIADSLAYQAAGKWPSVKPECIEKDRWYIIFTDWLNFRIGTYNVREQKWNIHLGQIDGGEHVVSYLPAEFKLTEGTEVKGIRYVHFYPWRFKEDSVVIYPLDKIKLRLKTNKLATQPLCQSYEGTLAHFMQEIGIKQEDILEIDLIKSDLNDPEYVKEVARQEEIARKAEAEMEEKRRKLAEAEEAQRQYLQKQAQLREEQLRKEKEKREQEELVHSILIKHCHDNNLSENLVYVKEQLEKELLEQRQTGRTTRIVNQIIEDFYQKPKYKMIPIIDHLTEEQNKLNSQIVNLVKQRLNGSCKYEIKYDVIAKTPYIVRLSDTYSEKLIAQLEEINKKLGIE